MSIETIFDVAIVGAGATGLAASIEAASLGMQTILIGRGRPGGAMNRFVRIEAETGFPVGLSGAECAGRSIDQAVRFGVSLQTVEVVGLRSAGADFVVETAPGTSTKARSVIIATGAEERLPSIQGVEEFFGVGVYTRLPRELAPSLRDRIVVVANRTGADIDRIAGWDAAVHVVTKEACRNSRLSPVVQHAPRISVSYQTEIVCVDGVDHLESILLRGKRTKETSAVSAAALFVVGRSTPRTEWLPARVARDESGFVLSGKSVGASARYGTSVPGLFAAGSVRQPDDGLTPFAEAIDAAREVRTHLRQRGDR